MNRISAVEAVIHIAWLLLLLFLLRTSTAMILQRNPGSKFGAALAYII